MTTTTDCQSCLGDLAREMDSPTTVIWTSIHVIKRCLQHMSEESAVAGFASTTDAGSSESSIVQMHKNLDLVIEAGEHLVRVNKSLQRAIRRQGAG